MELAEKINVEKRRQFLDKQVKRNKVKQNMIDTINKNKLAFYKKKKQFK